MANGSSLNRAKYSGLDFDTHNDDLLSRIQVKFAADFNDFAVSSLGIMLLDLTSFGLDTLSFYLDRRASDTYLSTAFTRKSVSRATRQVGYKMGGAVAASTELEVSVDDPKAFNVPIPEGFRFSGPNDLIFEAAREVVFTPGEQASGTVKTVPVFEGETIVEQFVSTGLASQVFELRSVPENKQIVQGTVTVVVDGSDFEEVDLLEYGATDQFETGFNDDPPTIRFGDGISGSIPTSGATIDVTYVASRGLAGQVAQNTITSVDTPLVVSFQQIGLTITNPSPAVGGDDLESLSSAKANAPQVYKSRRVAVVESDYEGLSGAYSDPLFGRVAVAKAIASRSADTDLTLQNYITDISTAIAAFDPTVQTQTGAITTALVSLSDALAAIISASTASTETSISSAVSVIDSDAQSIRNNRASITVDSADISSLVTDGKAEVDLYGPAGTAALAAGEADGIKEFFDRIEAESLAIAASASLIETSALSVISQSDGISSLVATLSSLRADKDAGVTSATTAATSIETANDLIIVADTDVVTDVAAATNGIFTHVDLLLAADCQANLVTVPILTKDSGGFYTAPSIGLIESLQAYLDERKEVTQTVAVTSGESFLIAAVVTVRVGVNRGFSEQAVKSAVEIAIDGLLRDRAFGAILYEVDIEQVVGDIDGVRFSNVSITGPGARLDADGNLIPLDSEVVTKGAVTINTESVVE